MDGPFSDATETTVIEIRRLSGVSIQVVVKASDTIKAVKRDASLKLGIPEPFLKLCCQTTEVTETEVVANLKEPVLHLVVLDRLPFQESVTPLGARVLVDGCPAEYGSSSNGWSDKICFDFDPPGHPRLGGGFATKYWRCERPGFIQWGHGSDQLHVVWLCPDTESHKQIAGGAAAQSLQAWCTVRSVLVRSGANLDSASICRLAAGQELLVTEAIFLEGADATPRLRIISPQEGWLTPYLKSNERVLAVPRDFGSDSSTDTLADIARICEQAARTQ